VIANRFPVTSRYSRTSSEVFPLVSARFVHCVAIGISLFSFARHIESAVPHASIKFQALGKFLSSRVLLEGSGGGFAVAIRGVQGRVAPGTTRRRLTRTTVLLYMATPEDVSKRRCTKMPLRAPHSSQVHGGQHAQRTESVTKPEYSTSSPHVWPHHSGPQSDLTLSSGPERDPTLSPFAVTDFKVLVDDDHQPVHCSAQMQLNGRLDSSDVVDLASWHLRYAEFGFLQSEAEDWIRSGRRILVGTASADLMTEVRPDADLTIIFDLHSHLDLSGYEHLECMTRFCNHDEIAVGSRSPPESARPYQKEARTSCEYRPDSQGSQGTLRIKFNAHPWLIQMRKHQNMRDILQGNVGGLLQRMTARQDIYGVVADTGETQCLITVLWRFKLTKSSSEVGNIEWRSISLASCEPVAEERWYQGAEYKTGNLGDMGTGHERTPVVLASTTTDVTPYYQADQLPLDLSHTYRSHRTYQTEAHHGYQPPPLSIDILGSMQSGSDHLDTSAATTATEFSRPSFASSHTPGMVSPNIHGNDFNFDSGHIVISGAFESTSNTSTYGSFLSQSAGLEDLHTLAGLDHDEFATMGISIAEHGQLFPLDASTNLHHSADPACYSAKPAWQHAHLTSHLDNGAEQFHSHLGHADHTQVARNHRSLHGCDAHQQLCQRGESLATGLHDATHSFWGVQGLQSPCQDNMSSGDVNRVEYREEQTQSSDYDVPDVVQRDPTGRSY
jgi:transcriptional enhancer factor